MVDHMFSRFDIQTWQMLIGNLLLTGCCAFYILWWLIAFKPNHPIKGMRSGWLLIGAFAFGLAGVIQIVRGSNLPQGTLGFASRRAILIGGIAAYVILLAATYLIFKRQVTSELFLITGWAMLTFMEINALYALGMFTRSAGTVFLAITLIAAAVSIVCYILYYRLDGVKAYIDGIIPLALAAGIMISITIAAAA